MRIILLLFFLFCFGSTLNSQTALLKYWVQFTDKESTPYSVSDPIEFLSPLAISLREKFEIPIEIKDLPVDPSYVSGLADIEGVRIIHSSKWFNAVTIELVDSTYIESVLPIILSSNNVLELKNVSSYSNAGLIIKESGFEKRKSDSYATIYGPSYGQIAIHNGQLLHELGLRGEGVQVGVFDSGFDGVNFLSAFATLRDEGRLKFQYDIVDDDDNVLNGGHHGKSVLSIMTAFMPDSIIGSAPEANYHLFRTEDGSSEHVTEEDNWIRALEMADSMGIQLINSSLGYTTFDIEDNSHSYEDMDGNTTRISVAADIAASKGMLIVNSAGNSGDDPWFYIGAPADADSILSVGAVSDKGEYAWFSSQGPSFDGDVKPNVCGVGYQTVYADLTEGIKRGNGTSFSSPVIAGLTACLWQAFPEKSNMEIIEAIENSSHLIGNPNDSLGYGIPDFFQAFRSLSENEGFVDSGFIVYPNPFNELLQIAYPNGEIESISIVDAMGKLVYNSTDSLLGEGISVLVLNSEVADLSQGIYYLNFLKEDKVLKAVKIVKN